MVVLRAGTRIVIWFRQITTVYHKQPSRTSDKQNMSELYHVLKQDYQFRTTVYEKRYCRFGETLTGSLLVTIKEV